MLAVNQFEAAMLDSRVASAQLMQKSIFIDRIVTYLKYDSYEISDKGSNR